MLRAGRRRGLVVAAIGNFSVAEGRDRVSNVLLGGAQRAQDLVSYMPSMSMARLATSRLEYCCWPVTRRPSRIATGLNSGMTWTPAALSLKFYSMLENPVTVFPAIRYETSERVRSTSAATPWHNAAVIFLAS